MQLYEQILIQKYDIHLKRQELERKRSISKQENKSIYLMLSDVKKIKMMVMGTSLRVFFIQRMFSLKEKSLAYLLTFSLKLLRKLKKIVHRFLFLQKNPLELV